MLLHMYPKNVATIYAMTEASFSFAEMIGPTFGALIYNYGGFILPFEICGGLCLLTGRQGLGAILNLTPVMYVCINSGKKWLDYKCSRCRR
jgi:MFS family permease